jgi:uncharacterized membrane protein (DUF485 family)
MATTGAPAEGASLAAIAANPKYQELIRKRTAFGWTLTIIMLIAFFGYIGLIAFDKAFLAQPISAGGVTSLGIPVGLGLIVLSIVLTAVYVVRANSEFDRLTREILEEAGQ